MSVKALFIAAKFPVSFGYTAQHADPSRCLLFYACPDQNVTAIVVWLDAFS